MEVTPTFISNVTDSVLKEVREFQNRPLEAVYLAVGINLDGLKEVLGMWIAKTEGAKFWLNVLTELENRGVQDVFIAGVDGLKGFPEAIEAVFPQTQIQVCIVHMVRNSLKYVSWKQRPEMANDLKRIYQADTETMGLKNLEAFAEKWDSTHPTISESWKNNWPRLATFFEYPEAIRHLIYTTNAIESLNMSLRKIIKTRGSFPNDEAVFKIVYLGLKKASKKWTLPVKNWKEALNHFAILYEDRMENLG